MPTVFFRLFSLSEGKEQITKMLVSIYLARNWIYTNLLGANTVQKSADEGEIKSKDGHINAAFA